MKNNKNNENNTKIITKRTTTATTTTLPSSPSNSTTSKKKNVVKNIINMKNNNNTENNTNIITKTTITYPIPNSKPTANPTKSNSSSSPSSSLPPHSFDKIEKNPTCRPDKVNDKSTIYKTKNNFWNSTDVNRKTSSYTSGLISPYANVTKDDLKKWGNKCQNKCHYSKCSTARQEIDKTLKIVLKEWLRLTSGEGELNMCTFNCFGSLISSRFRGNVLMQWDTDFDYLIWAHDTEKIEQFMDEYNNRPNNPFRLTVQPDWRCKFNEFDDENWGGRRYYNKNGRQVKTSSLADGFSGVSDYVAPHSRLIHRATNWHVDIWAMYAGNYSATKGKDFAETIQSVNFLDVEYEYVNIPRNEIFPLEECYLEGLKTWCPVDGASVLSRTYRSRNLQEPDHHLDYDTGCWVKEGKKKGE